MNFYKQQFELKQVGKSRMIDDLSNLNASAPTNHLLNSLATLREAAILFSMGDASSMIVHPLGAGKRIVKLADDQLPPKLAIDAIDIVDLYWLIECSCVLFISKDACSHKAINEYLSVAKSIGFRIVRFREN
jgi:hypothetical protein